MAEHSPIANIKAAAKGALDNVAAGDMTPEAYNTYADGLEGLMRPEEAEKLARCEVVEVKKKGQGKKKAAEAAKPRPLNAAQKRAVEKAEEAAAAKEAKEAAAKKADEEADAKEAEKAVAAKEAAEGEGGEGAEE